MFEGPKPEVSPRDFSACDLRIGTVIQAEPLPAARKPATVLHIDFGERIGVLKSSAQVTARYTAAELIGRQVVAVVNFPPLQVGSMRSQCLVLGGVPETGDVVLLHPDAQVPNGTPVA